MEDLGSGELFDLRQVGVHGEPMIADSLRAGVDLVTYSGDKLLGGPQAGLISGDPELVAKVRSNPLFRALRVDKMFYAALEATLLAYLREDYDSIPALRMMRVSDDDLQHRAEHIARHLRISSPQLEIEIVESRSVLGGGSAPGSTLPSRALAVKCATVAADAAGAACANGRRRSSRGWKKIACCSTCAPSSQHGCNHHGRAGAHCRG